MYVFVISLIIISIIILAYYEVLANRRLDVVEKEVNNIKLQNQATLKNVEKNQERLEKEMQEYFKKNEEFNEMFQRQLEEIEKNTKKNN